MLFLRDTSCVLGALKTVFLVKEKMRFVSFPICAETQLPSAKFMWSHTSATFNIEMSHCLVQSMHL